MLWSRKGRRRASRWPSGVGPWLGFANISIFCQFRIHGQIFCHSFVNPKNRKVLSPIFASLNNAVVGSLSNCR
jgi:hypothetical protein